MSMMTAVGAFAGATLDDGQADVTVAVPDLRPRDVLVRVHGVLVNPVDVKRRAGLSRSAFNRHSPVTSLSPAPGR
ncbi:hypothetical protein NIIDNTM18_06600 [Mycolicibacterium litorale]|uniref:Uncharacterized protein n=1 Tax=Mycolicibacterium litorale TaxID=758802 RepID=A0A6S6NZV8_9MYCO|nr:hypothetical protein NIIDNTM18_06600 [Mycolicibacterium litorale]